MLDHVPPVGAAIGGRPVIVIMTDHMAVAESLAHTLDCVHGIDTIGIAADVAELENLFQWDRPHAVIAETHLSDLTSTLDLLDLTYTESGLWPVIFFAAIHRPGHLHKARERGAAGYVLQASPLRTLARAIRVVATGGTYFDRKLRQSTHAPVMPSQREVQLLELLAAGHANLEIGHLLGISSRTVESHLRRLFARYGVSSRVQLLMLAVREAWISPAGTIE